MAINFYGKSRKAKKSSGFSFPSFGGGSTSSYKPPKKVKEPKKDKSSGGFFSSIFSIFSRKSKDTK